MTKKNLCALLISAIILSGVIILATGCNGPEEVIGVRFKSFANTGSNEIYLGVPDLGSTATSVRRGAILGRHRATMRLHSFLTGVVTS